MNINEKSAELFNSLMGKVPLATLYEEVLGMTKEEAEKARDTIYQEHIRHHGQVEAIYVAKARNDARRACGFREKIGEEVKPMDDNGLARLFGGRPAPAPAEDEEEL